MNNELKKINNWMNLNRLTVNYLKTNYIIFTRRDLTKQFNIAMETNKLERVESTRYLGGQLDQKLNSSSYIFSKLRYYLDISCLKMIYYFLVYPLLNYCVTDWGGASETSLQPIIILQKRILRFVTHNSYDSHTKPIFLKHKILPFNFIYQLNLAKLMHKIHNNVITGSYELTPLSQKHTYNTRLAKGENYYQKYNKTSYGQSTFCNQGLIVWRNVPKEFKSLPPHLFKNRLKKQLLKSFETN